MKTVTYHAPTIKELISALQDIVKENPKLADSPWFGYDDEDLVIQEEKQDGAKVYISPR